MKVNPHPRKTVKKSNCEPVFCEPSFCHIFSHTFYFFSLGFTNRSQKYGRDLFMTSLYSHFRPVKQESKRNTGLLQDSMDTFTFPGLLPVYDLKVNVDLYKL